MVELDPSEPFTVARGQTEGLVYLLKCNPDLEYVQFLDGDYELVDEWLDKGQNTLETRPDHSCCLRKDPGTFSRTLYLSQTMRSGVEYIYKNWGNTNLWRNRDHADCSLPASWRIKSYSQRK